MSTQSGKQVFCAATGRMKNCGSWAEYEDGHTGTSALCNGGIYDDDSYSACPSRSECMSAMVEASRQPQPLANAARTQVLGATQASRVPPVAQQLAAAASPMSWGDYRNRERANLPTTMAAARGAPASGAAGARPAQQLQQYPSNPYPVYPPTPVRPPDQYPTAMQTQYAAPVPFHAGGITPTFLPDDDESIAERLLKNIGQGMIGSTGWNVFDLARTVDFFGRK